MSKFLAGFLSASLLWGGFVYATETGLISINLGKEEEVAEEPEAAIEEEAPDPGGRRKRARRKPGSRKFRGVSQTGDDLGDPETRNLAADQAGGEEQLRSQEIEQGFDGVFPKIRRCLMLAASEEPVSGKIMFGLRIAGSGKVTAVNLKGPGAITQSEAGGCMRDAARGIQFRSFDGPDMLVHYPFVLE